MGDNGDSNQGDNVNNSSNGANQTTNMIASAIQDEGTGNLSPTQLLENGKRGRDMDKTEWTTVSKRGKKLESDSCLNDKTTYIEANNITEICMTGKGKLPKQIGLARIFKAEKIEDIIKVKYVNSYKIVIQFKNNPSAEKLMQCQYFIENGFRCQKTFEVGVSYGLIKDIDLELIDEDVLSSLKSDIEILSVKRLQRRNFYDDNKWEPSEVIRVSFKGAMRPPYLYIHDLRVAVEPYEFPVTQCSRCWKFGHTLKVCPSNRIVCPKCKQNHPNCEATKFVCANCSGNHMALARICPIYLKEKRLRQLMADFNCTYKRALTIYVPPSPPIATSTRVRPQAHTITGSERTDNILRRPADDSPRYIAPTQPQSLAYVNDSDMDRSPTYAEVLTTNAQINTSGPVRNATSGQRGKSSKNKHRSSADKSRYEYNVGTDGNQQWESMSVLSETEESEIHVEEEMPKQKKSRDSRWWELFHKLKYTMLEKSSTIEDKIKLCGSIILEWSINYFVDNYPDWSIIKSITGIFNG